LIHKNGYVYHWYSPLVTKDNHRQLREDMSDSDLPTSDSYNGSPLIDLRVVAGVIQHGDHILAAKRLAGGPSGLKWEFPGGKVEQGETGVEALRREIYEELGIDVQVGEFIGTFATPLGKYLIQLECYWCTSSSRTVHLSSHDEFDWFTTEDLMHLDWAIPDIPVVDQVLSGLRGLAPL